MNNQTSLFNTMGQTSTQLQDDAVGIQTKNIRPQAKEKLAKKTVRKSAAITKSRLKAAAAEIDQMYRVIVDGLQKYFSAHNYKRVVLGISGGVDSSLTLKIAVDALGAKNVTAVSMPELGLTKQENIDHAKLLCHFLGANYYYQPINNMMVDFNIAPWKPSQLANMNTKARIRAILLYSLANTENSLVLGTSNKSELLMGYGTKYGDLAADVEVLGDLLKTEVVKMADYIGLPPEIVNKVPTAELAQGQTDEAELGATYADLDKVLAKIDLGIEGCVEYGLPENLVRLVFKRMKENGHKLNLPVVIRAKSPAPLTQSI